MFRDCEDTLNEPIRRTNNPFAESGTKSIEAFMFDKIYHHSPSTGFYRFPPVLLLGYFVVFFPLGCICTVQLENISCNGVVSGNLFQAPPPRRMHSAMNSILYSFIIVFIGTGCSLGRPGDRDEALAGSEAESRKKKKRACS